MKNYKSKFMKKKKIISGIVVALTAQVISTTVYAASITSITVNLNDRVETIKTKSHSVEEVLKELDVDFGKYDYINYSLDEEISEAMNIEWVPAKEVSLTLNGDTKTIWTTSTTISELLNESNIHIGENDLVLPAPTTEIQDNLEISITHAIPVTLIVDDREELIYTTTRSVNNFLIENEIHLNELDRVTPAQNDSLKVGGSVVITRVEKRTVINESEISYNTVTNEDDSMLVNERKIITQGSNGILQTTSEEIYENGLLVESSVISNEIIKAAVDEIIAVGTRINQVVTPTNTTAENGTTIYQIPQTPQVPSQVNSSDLIGFSRQFLGTSYVFGGSSPSGFDCSGYVQYVFKNSIGVSLPRSSASMFNTGSSVSTPAPGDLVFFRTGSTITHVGISLGGDSFINSNYSGVKIDSLSSSYWGPKYAGAKRVN